MSFKEISVLILGLFIQEFPAICHIWAQQIPAKTGKDSNNNTAVTTTAHPNKASLCKLIPGALILSIVVMTKLIVIPIKKKKNTTIKLDYIFRVSNKCCLPVTLQTTSPQA